MPYQVEYSPAAVEHLRGLNRRDQVAVIDAVERQLRLEPTIETRNRKRMRPNPIAPWEMRIGDLRVYYDVKDEREAVVQILAIGVKQRNRVRIGKEEVEL